MCARRPSWGGGIEDLPWAELPDPLTSTLLFPCSLCALLPRKALMPPPVPHSAYPARLAPVAYASRQVSLAVRPPCPQIRLVEEAQRLLTRPCSIRHDAGITEPSTSTALLSLCEVLPRGLAAQE